MTTNANNELKEETENEIYWKQMYDELEDQMHNMMEMTLELIDKELKKQETNILKSKNPRYEAKIDIPKNFEKEYRRLKLFEHRINVTFLGKITLKYIALKSKLRKLIRGK